MPESSYAENADFWVKIIREGLDRYRSDLTDQAVLDAIGAANGLTILDAGCGEGYLSRLLAQAGALPIGVDICPDLVQSAQDLATQSNYKSLTMPELSITYLSPIAFVMSSCVTISSMICATYRPRFVNRESNPRGRSFSHPNVTPMFLQCAHRALYRPPSSRAHGVLPSPHDRARIQSGRDRVAS